MTDQPSARDVIAAQLNRIRGFKPVTEWDYLLADEIITALRSAGLWAAPWEATKAMVAAWAATDQPLGYGDWAAMRDAYLQPKPGE